MGEPDPDPLLVYNSTAGVISVNDLGADGAPRRTRFILLKVAAQPLSMSASGSVPQDQLSFLFDPRLASEMIESLQGAMEFIAEQ